MGAKAYGVGFCVVLGTTVLVALMESGTSNPAVFAGVAAGLILGLVLGGAADGAARHPR